MPRTRTVMVHEAPPANEVLARLTVVAALLAVSVPPQVDVAGVAGLVVVVSTTKPLGKVSVNAIPVRVVLAFGLLILKVRSVVLPVKIGFAVNDFAIAGGSTTVRAA